MGDSSSLLFVTEGSIRVRKAPDEMLPNPPRSFIGDRHHHWLKRRRRKTPWANAGERSSLACLQK